MHILSSLEPVYYVLESIT